IAFIDARNLNNPAWRHEIGQLFAAGIPVMVRRASLDEHESRSISSLLGVASPATIALYSPGVVRNHITSFPDSIDRDDPPSFRAQLFAGRSASLSSGRSNSHGASPPGSLPMVEWVHQTFGKYGSSVSITVTVLRDFTPSKDRKVVIVHGNFNLTPKVA